MSRASNQPDPGVPAGGPTRVSPWRFWGIAVLFVVALGLVQVASSVLLLVFAGVLFGTSLRGLAEVVSSHTRLPMHASLAACLLAIVALVTGAVIWGFPRVTAQVEDLVAHLEVAAASIREQLQRSELGRRILEPSGNLIPSVGSLARAAGVLASTLGVVGSAVFVVFVSLYVAISPQVYRRGFVRLVPPAHRERTEDILDTLGSTLRRWMVGRLVSMSAVGIATSVGLWALGVPLPLTLGMLSGMLGFIPNIGPIISAIPALLLAATLGPAYIVYVLLLYLAINLVDGYVLTPLVDRRSVSNPPALVITSQLLFGVLWGALGIMLATPLVACAIVIVRRVYVDRLEGSRSKLVEPDAGGLPRVQLRDS